MDRTHKVTEIVIGDELQDSNQGRNWVKNHEKKQMVYVYFRGLEKAYNMVRKEVVGLVLTMQDVGGKLFNNIKSIYVTGLDSVRVKKR